MKQAMAVGLTLLLFLAAGPAYPQVSIPENLRSLLPEYSGQKVLLAFSSPSGDHVTLEIPDDFATAAQFYKRHFLERGWEVKMEMGMEDTNMFSLVKGGLTLGIIVSRTDEKASSVNFNLERQ